MKVYSVHTASIVLYCLYHHYDLCIVHLNVFTYSHKYGTKYPTYYRSNKWLNYNVKAHEFTVVLRKFNKRTRLRDFSLPSRGILDVSSSGILRRTK